MGAPRDYDRDAMIPVICKRMSEGETLSSICRDLDVPRQTVNRWRREEPEIDKQMQEARDLGFDAIADECLAIADDGRRDYKPDDEGREIVDHDHIQRSKLRVDTRLKLLAKWDPKRYGERVDLNHSGKMTLESLVTGAGSANDE